MKPQGRSTLKFGVCKKCGNYRPVADGYCAACYPEDRRSPDEREAEESERHAEDEQRNS